MTAQRKPRSGPVGNRQRGQAALLTVLLIFGIGVTAIVYSLATPAKISIENDKKTAAALALAKDALIGRAANDGNRPGSLPCPDLITNISGNVPNDGIADLLSGNECPSYIGRLPWRTLGLPDLRDSSGERLWYALSRTFRDDDSAQPINSDTTGLFTVTLGSTTLTGVIAVVFAPELVVASQNRNSANENDVTHYLEGSNENGVTGTMTYAFTTSQTISENFNDKLLPITSEALFSVVVARVLREMRNVLTYYYGKNGYFPNANAFSALDTNCSDGVVQGRIPQTIRNPPRCLLQTNSDWNPPSWFFDNNWNRVVFYAVADSCTELGLLSALCGALGNPLNLFGSPTRALLIGTSRGFPNQTNRPCGLSNCTLADLLEDAENTNGDNVFVKPTLSSSNNDRLVVVSP